jgi:hypothetical protein
MYPCRIPYGREFSDYHVLTYRYGRYFEYAVPSLYDLPRRSGGAGTSIKIDGAAATRAERHDEEGRKREQLLTAISYVLYYTGKQKRNFLHRERQIC